jgi:hypothetical protein
MVGLARCCCKYPHKQLYALMGVNCGAATLGVARLVWGRLCHEGASSGFLARHIYNCSVVGLSQLCCAVRSVMIPIPPAALCGPTVHVDTREWSSRTTSQRVHRTMHAHRSRSSPSACATFVSTAANGKRPFLLIQCLARGYLRIVRQRPHPYCSAVPAVELCISTTKARTAF